MASYPPSLAEIPIPSYLPPPGPPPQMTTPDLRGPPPSGIHLTRDAEYLIQSFLPATQFPPAFQTPKLPLPYCAPQLTPAFDAPFCRAYNSTLESVDISQEQLLAFIDGLNLAMTASPPLRVVNLVGMAIGFVPYHWAMIAGAAIQTGAQVGMRVLSKTLTDRYLRAANLRLFKPRGLSVRICTTAAMQHLVMGTPIAAPPSKITRVGRGVGTVLMRVPIPLASVLVHAIADKPPTVRAMDPASFRSKKLLAAQRRAAMLEGYALPLDFDMPKPAKAEGVMDTMSSWGVKFDSWRDGRKQSKAEDLRLELERERAQGGPSQSGGGGLIGGLLNARSGVQLRDRHGGERFGAGDDYAGRRRLGDRGAGRQPGGLVGLVGGLVLGGGGENRFGRRDASGAGGAGRQAGGLAGLVGQTTIGSLVMGRANGGGILDRRRGQTELQVADADLIEHWQSAKVLWVVIMNSEMDEEIEGIERAESREDEERIDEQTWRAEMQVEREDREFDAELERVAENQAQKSASSH
ncbi:hypothetical protein B0H19DRAFT_1378246 [Mycena capillaripes]|nr:hypothetical protein B0H19DRAFT_1378246 [Mycena capillaripes]